MNVSKYCVFISDRLSGTNYEFKALEEHLIDSHENECAVYVVRVYIIIVNVAT